MVDSQAQIIPTDRELAQYSTAFEEGSQTSQTAHKIDQLLQHGHVTGGAMKDSHNDDERTSSPSAEPIENAPVEQADKPRQNGSKFLRRPPSSHQPASLGFAFGKALAKPPLNIAIKTSKHSEIPSIERDPTPPSAQLPVERQVPAGIHPSVTTEPFPNAWGSQKGVTEEHRDSQTPAQPTLRATPDLDMSTGVITASDLPKTSCPITAAIPTAPVSRQSARPSSRARLTSSRGSASIQYCKQGVTKDRKTSRHMTHAQFKAPSIPRIEQCCEDQLLALQSAIRQIQHKCDIGKRDMEEELIKKDEEIQMLDDNLNTLAKDFEALQSTMIEKETAIADMKQVKTILTAKCKKLTNFVKGLCSDHNNLSKEAREIGGKQSELSSDETAIRQMVATMQANNEANKIKGESLQEGYRKHIRTLNDTVASLQRRIEEEPRADMTQERNRCLEDELAKIADKHERLLAEHANLANEVSQKLDNLLDRSEATNHAVPTSDHSPILQECLTLMREMSARKNVQPEDLINLDASMKMYTNSVRESMQEYEQNSEQVITSAQKLSMSVQKDLSAMSGNAVTADVLRDQMSEQRELKATLKERLHTTELRLAELRCEKHALAKHEQLQSSKILALEAEIARSREASRNPPKIMLRLHDVETANKELRDQESRAERKSAKVTQELQQKSAEVASLSDSLVRSEQEVERLKNVERDLQAERTAFERQVETDSANMKQQYSVASEQRLLRSRDDHEREKSQMTAEFDAAKKEVRRLMAREQQVVPANADAQIQASLIAQLEKEKQQQVDGVANLSKSLTTLQTKVAEEAHRRHVAESKVATLEGEVQVAKERNNELQARVNRITLEEETRVMRMHEMQTSNATPVSTVQETRSKHFVQPPATVEDSQPRELADIANSPESDSFTDAAEHLDEELAGIFPVSPPREQQVSQKETSSHDRVTSRRSHTTIQTELIRRGHNANNYPWSSRAHSIATSSQDSQATASQLVSNMKTRDTQNDSQHRDPPKSASDSRLGNQSQKVLDSSQISQSSKRDAAAAEFGAQRASTVKRPRQDPHLAGLGHVVVDSESPGHLLNGRGRKLSTKRSKKSKKEAHMNVRFHEELKGSPPPPMKRAIRAQ